MPRLIDSNALIDWLTKPTGFIRNCDDCPDIDCVHCVIEDAIKTAPTVDAIPVKDLERILSTTPGLELWDYQKRGIMSAVNRLCGKEKNDG